jgi:hypothetical protein
MKTLTTLLSLCAMTIALGGCPKKNEDKKTTEAAKPAETKPAETTKPEETKPAETTPAGNLPAECADYKAMVEKLATCEKMPKESRDALKQSFDAAAPTWANVTPETKATVAESCKKGAEALKAAAASTCGW